MSLAIRSRSFYCCCVFLFAASCFFSRTARAQLAETTIRLNGREITLADNGPAWLAQPQAPVLALVQFDALPDAEAKARIATDGITLYTYLSERTFIARIERSKGAPAISGIRSILPIEPAWKITPALTQLPVSSKADVMISFVAGTKPELIREQIAALGGNLRPAPLAEHGFYEATLPVDKMLRLAAGTEVLYIGAAAIDRPLNLESQCATKANIAHASRASGGWGLLGDSITVGVGDNVPGLFHVDLRDRVINYNPQGYGNHGQHVNGSVGGAGTMDPRGEGFAPHARLVDHLYNLVWARTGAMLQAHNMTITNNSYANIVGNCTTTGAYDLYAQALDTLSLMYPEVFHVFAAGNDGRMSCPPFPTSYSTITGGYQAAKNVLVVANVNKYYGVDTGSSRGPIRDGRLKPEISAIGADVYSTKGGDTYLSAFGTSMACPQISGIAALLQQRYKQLYAGAYPSSALMKAILMNGALDLGIPGPDFTFGFGMADLTRSLTMLDNNQHLQASIAHGGSATPVTITVPPNTGQLKVMLYWHDRPASPMSATQLINDLDLKVQHPSGVYHLPAVLDATPGGVATPAVPGADHLNNVEQVVIDYPAAGNYAVQIAGFSVPFGPQDYTIVYDLAPAGITLTTPFKDDAYKWGDVMNLYWNASPGTNTFAIEYSTDNGNSWTLLSNSVPATNRHFTWPLTGPVPINSAQCRVRITRNGTSEQAISGAFAINEQPLLQLSAVQCPGYASLHWSPVPNATGYTVLRKTGPFLQPLATITDTLYHASALKPDSLYYFAVQPLFGSAKGYRSMGISRRPDTGNCAGAFSDGDLMLADIESPSSGRVATSTALTSIETLSIRVRNLDDAVSGSYRVSYQLNGGSWISQTLSGIPVLGSAVATFTGLNLAAPGSYSIRAAISNLSMPDPVRQNDTLIRVVRQLQNPAITLSTGFEEHFESLPRLVLQADTMGFTPDERWDYFNSNDTGRLRSFVDADITIDGTRSISMDMQQNAGAVFNRLTGTFNLATSSTATDEVRLEFDYRLHGKPKTADSNRVWVRGGDTQPWMPLYQYDQGPIPGTVHNSGTLSVTDALVAGGQSFTSATQIAFGQRDTSVIAENDYGNGLTLDGVKLYKVVNDIGIAGVVSPLEGACELSNATPLTLAIYNGVTVGVGNILLYYQLDGGAIVVDTISFLAGKAKLDFTFSQLMNAAAYGPHTLNVWLVAANDSYHTNDSILSYVFRNEPLISSFPYLQDFESGDGYWYSSGLNSSWEFGTPASTKIRKAASGVNAWKTRLKGRHNNNERSYLYSPCFNTGGLANPMLSFSVAMEIEDCDQFLCDGAWVEYSLDGHNWIKLGVSGQGTNWYNDTAFQVWKMQGRVRWQVASIPIPSASQPIRFRIAISSDAGLAMEGIALDDIHIYDRINPSYTGGTIGPISQSIAGNGFAGFIAGGALVAQINPGSSDPGKTDVFLYGHTNIIDIEASRYFLTKSFVVNTANVLTDSVTARLYITDADVLALVNASGCEECSKAADAYELGITKYDNSNISLENGSLSDNVGGTYEFIPYSRIRWVPYDAGYYAEVRLASFSELWFNAGGAGQAFPLTVGAVDFHARKASPEAVLTTWVSHIDTLVTNYEVQRSEEPRDFETIRIVGSARDNSHSYSYLDIPGNVTSPALYYRLKYILRDSQSFYSPIRQVIWSGQAAAVNVYPNPVTDGRINIAWSTRPGETLEVSVTNIVGAVILRASEKASGYDTITELNFGNVSKGIYFLHANVAGERFDFKIQVP